MRHPGFRWVGGLLVVVTLMLLVRLAGSTRPLRVPLADGGQLEVVSVKIVTNRIVSFEPTWKQLARRILPDGLEGPLGPSLVWTNRTTNEALSIVVRRMGTNASTNTRPRLRHPLVLFEEPYSAVGEILRSASGDEMIRFEAYPREQREIKVRVQSGDESISIVVPNPKPSTPMSWRGLTLPLTNEWTHTRLVLRQSDRPSAPTLSARPSSIALALSLQSKGNAETGWNRAQYSIIDASGNRIDRGWSSDTRRFVLPITSAHFKIVLAPEEYLSAGFVPGEPVILATKLAISPRARELGARAVVVVQPGRFQIANDGTIAAEDTVPLESALRWVSSGANAWTARLETSITGILVVAEEDADSVRFKARLRERIRAGDGRVFPHWPWLAATNSMGGRARVATFFVHERPHSLGNSAINRRRQIHSTETQLEAELIVVHPRTEFQVESGGSTVNR